MPRVPKRRRFKHRKDHDRGATIRAARKAQDDGCTASVCVPPLYSPGPSSDFKFVVLQSDDVLSTGTEKENSLDDVYTASECIGPLYSPDPSSDFKFVVLKSDDVLSTETEKDNSQDDDYTASVCGPPLYSPGPSSDFKFVVLPSDDVLSTATEKDNSLDDVHTASECVRPLYSPDPSSDFKFVVLKSDDVLSTETEKSLHEPATAGPSLVFPAMNHSLSLDFKLPLSDADDNSIMSLSEEDPLKVPLIESDDTSLHSSQKISFSGLLMDSALLEKVKTKVEKFLYNNCICLTQDDQIHILFLSRSEDKVTQRQLSFAFDGNFSLRVHCKPYPVDNIVKDILPHKQLNSSSVGYFADRMVQVINLVRKFEICEGIGKSKYKNVWSMCDRGQVDKNPYKESRYTETFRSDNCESLVNLRRRRCVQCTKLVSMLERKHEMASKEKVHPNTPNICISESQMLNKLQEQRRQIENTKRRLERLDGTKNNRKCGR